MIENDGDLVIRTLAMPSNTNINGDIFGGWIISQMDIGGCIAAQKITNGKVVTVAIDSMKFVKPISIGDTVCVYAKKIKKGNTSIKYSIKTYVTRRNTNHREKVTEAIFTYVKVNEDGIPVKI